MASIKQKPGFSMASPKAEGTDQGTRNTRRVPDFRNLGICLHIILAVNVLMAMAAILQGASWTGILTFFTEMSAFAQPALILSLGLLYTLYPWLKKQAYPLAMGVAACTPLVSITAIHLLGSAALGEDAMPPFLRSCLLGEMVFLLVSYYLHLRYRALTPAIAEARLQALQARIRPHFLFNSLNAVLSLIRSQPKRAETALEDMADLFRVLMADNRDLVPLAQEIALSRQYLALEKLRLDERLKVSWRIDNMPPDALIPPLVIQPLLENAVYHGIEPLAEGGEITIQIYSERQEVHLVLDNPYPAVHTHHHGNRMALANIRERLSLHFDAEASLAQRITEGHYEVHIVIPYHQHAAGERG